MPAWAEFAGTIGFLPFTHAIGTLPDTMAIGAFGFFMSMAMHERLNHVRLLRTLPFSSRHLIARVVLLSAVSGAMVWFALLVLHFVSTFSLPVNLRFDVFISAAAMMTLMSAVRFATLGAQMPPPVPQAIGITIPCTLWYAAFHWPVGSPALAMTLASLLVFFAGYALLMATISRSTRIYRAQPAVARFQ